MLRRKSEDPDVWSYEWFSNKFQKVRLFAQPLPIALPETAKQTIFGRFECDSIKFWTIYMSACINDVRTSFRSLFLCTSVPQCLARNGEKTCSECRSTCLKSQMTFKQLSKPLLFCKDMIQCLPRNCYKRHFLAFWMQIKKKKKAICPRCCWITLKTPPSDFFDSFLQGTETCLCKKANFLEHDWGSLMASNMWIVRFSFLMSPETPKKSVFCRFLQGADACFWQKTRFPTWLIEM